MGIGENLSAFAALTETTRRAGLEEREERRTKLPWLNFAVLAKICLIRAGV